LVSINFIEANGTKHTIEAKVGETVMEAARGNGIDGILADCGGSMSCATCHVHVAGEWQDRVGAPADDERAMLDMAIDPDETSRLSCQIDVRLELDGVVFRLPRSQI
jgi:2Fe-2S ferredoxin